MEQPWKSGPQTAAWRRQAPPGRSSLQTAHTFGASHPGLRGRLGSVGMGSRAVRRRKRLVPGGHSPCIM